ncbi:MAG: CDP-diacylglycerol--glycerol-3-phosphate 3-phosphatidyltransferase [Acidobacteriales bacterium]|nr:CDP-diacylglycerol--glycerol-3-phosphate 3-phosphatidyltransferase [Terriglobales bacterium]
MNLPNYLTLSRIAAVPLLIFLLSPKLPWFAEHWHMLWLEVPGTREFLAATVFILASITDGLLMVAGAFIALVQFNPSVVPAWIAVLVIAREFLVSGLRSIAAQQGFTIEASELGKLKMVVQIVAIVAAILHRHWLWLEVPVVRWDLDVELIARTAMWFMVGISLISAFDYFAGFWRKIDHSVQRSRKRRTFILSRRKKAAQAEEPSSAPVE